MAQSEKLEVLVLGSGTGGKLIAWYMARSGRRTAVVERHWVGGSSQTRQLEHAGMSISLSGDSVQMG